MTGATIFGCLGPELSADEKKFYRDANPWGFIVFARNLETPQQIRALTSEMRDALGRDVPILIDQEGGRVQRLRSPEWLEWLAPLEEMALLAPDRKDRAMWIRYRLIADELQGLGIDTNCAPMLDVPTKNVQSIIRDRCYGREPNIVAETGRVVAEGLLDGGVLPILKHIPGHGRPDADSHMELPRTNASAEDLRKMDFAPFRALSDLPMAMTAHVVYESLDPDLCATLSPTVLDIIRNEIGFDGLLMTDDISMKALDGSFEDRSAQALKAGCDVVLHCHGHMDEMIAVASAAGDMTPKVQARADRALTFRRVPGEIDKDALLAEHADLIMLAGNGNKPT